LRPSDRMSVGSSLFLIAMGAILYWAVTYQVRGVNLHLVGLILMGIGAIGLLFSLFAMPRRRLP
jgi:hypothetical protein